MTDLFVDRLRAAAQSFRYGMLPAVVVVTLMCAPITQAASPPEVELSSELMSRLLQGELEASEGNWAGAADQLFEVARATRDPRVARRAAEFYLQSGDLQGAYTAVQLWSETDPDSNEAAQSLLALSAALGLDERLGERLREQIARAVDRPLAINQTARTVERMQDPVAAFRVLETAYRDVLHIAEARLALARAALAVPDLERSVAEARAALRARPDWELAALVQLQAGFQLNPTEALTAAERFLVRYPSATEMRMALIRQATQASDFERALRLADPAAIDGIESLDLVYARGIIQYQAGQVSEAEAALRAYAVRLLAQQQTGNRAALSRSPDPAWLILAQIAEADGRSAEAIDFLYRVESAAESFNARLRAVQIMARAQGIDAARLALSQLIAADDSEQVRLVLTEAFLLRDAGLKEQALEVVEQALEALPQQPELMYDAALMIANADGPMERIEDLLRGVIEERPDHAHAYNALGYTMADRNIRLDEAYSLIRQALELAPDDAYILDSMGWVLFRRGDLTGALRYLERAWQIKRDAEIGAHLGEVLWALQRPDEGRRIWLESLGLDPTNQTLKDTLQRHGLERP